MCQPGSRYVAPRHERAASPRDIFGDGSSKLEGGRTPTRGPGISAKGPVGTIAGATGGRARDLIGESAAPAIPAPAPAAQSPTSINGMPPIAPAKDSGATPPEMRAQVDSAVANIRKEVGEVTTKPSPIQEFRGTPAQQQLFRDFAAICRDADSMPTGSQNRDARKTIRNRLCFRIQRSLNFSYVHGDKKKFAEAVRYELAQRLPSGTDIITMLPKFMTEWLEGRNLD